MSGSIYHEKQVKQLCAVHALNNLFQDKNAFSKADLDGISSSLAPGAFINPHRSFLGLGNYDVNVLMTALQSKGFAAVWFDKRRSVADIAFDQILGLILNIPLEVKFGTLHMPVQRKHWIAVRKIGMLYYNLDSKLESPEVVARCDNEWLTYLGKQLSMEAVEMLLVVGQAVHDSGSWQLR